MSGVVRSSVRTENVRGYGVDHKGSVLDDVRKLSERPFDYLLSDYLMKVSRRLAALHPHSFMDAVKNRCDLLKFQSNEWRKLFSLFTFPRAEDMCQESFGVCMLHALRRCVTSGDAD
uniref:Uncharacterized protein n=1 Tax=Cannabis sativa TaxID=3483 RepID=A0A803NGN7_CANSA